MKYLDDKIERANKFLAGELAKEEPQTEPQRSTRIRKIAALRFDLIHLASEKIRRMESRKDRQCKDE